jgi:hypothetical protein
MGGSRHEGRCRLGASARSGYHPDEHPACAVVEPAYQTRRQREARRADFQRTTLLQLRDALRDLDDAVLAFFGARYEALNHAGGWDKLASHHPAWEGIRRANSGLLLTAIAVDDKALRGQATALAHDVLLTAKASTASEAEHHREQLSSMNTKVTLALGEQLRRLP